MLKLDLNRLTQKLKSIENELRRQLSEKESDDRSRTFFKQFRIAVLNTKITGKQSDPKLVKGHWRDIIDSQTIATMLGKLKPFWNVINPTLIDDLVQKFGDEVVKKQMRGFQSELGNILKCDAMLLDFQIACTGRVEKVSLPRNFTSIFKIEVPQATSELSMKEIERYHDKLVRCALFHQSVLRFVPGAPTHSRSSVLTWHIPSNAVDIMKEYFDESLFHSSKLEVESVTLDDKPMQDFKEYQVYTRVVFAALSKLVVLMYSQKVLKLITACREHDMNALTEILESGADPNSANQVQSTQCSIAYIQLFI